jgi:hypothetical protein
VASNGRWDCKPAQFGECWQDISELTFCECHTFCRIAREEQRDLAERVTRDWLSVYRPHRFSIAMIACNDKEGVWASGYCGDNAPEGLVHRFACP